MKTITNYVDLCRKIDTIEIQLLQVDIDIDHWFGKEKLPFSRSDADELALTTTTGNIGDLQDKKYRLQKMLNFYLNIKKETEEKSSMLHDLNYQIARKKYIENKSYKQIADELNKSIGSMGGVASKLNY